MPSSKEKLLDIYPMSYHTALWRVVNMAPSEEPVEVVHASPLCARSHHTTRKRKLNTFAHLCRTKTFNLPEVVAYLQKAMKMYDMTLVVKTAFRGDELGESHLYLMLVPTAKARLEYFEQQLNQED